MGPMMSQLTHFNQKDPCRHHWYTNVNLMKNCGHASWTMRQILILALSLFFFIKSKPKTSKIHHSYHFLSNIIHRTNKKEKEIKYSTLRDCTRVALPQFHYSYHYVTRTLCSGLWSTESCKCLDWSKSKLYILHALKRLYQKIIEEN